MSPAKKSPPRLNKAPQPGKASRSPRRAPEQAGAVAPVPLAADLLTRPAEFGQAAARVNAWQYWPAPALSALLAGLGYALLLRPGLGLAAAAAGSPVAAAPPLLLTHIGNAFGSVFLTVLTFGVLWGLSRWAAGEEGRRLPLLQIWSATFTLPVLLSLLSLLSILVTPAQAWVPDTARVGAAGGDWLRLQRAALLAAAQTPAALLLIVTTLLGTAAQCLLAYRALRTLTPRAGLLAALPLLPALGLALLGLLPVLLARYGIG